MQGKVLFINFWATGCPPFIAEMPGINELYKQTDTDEVAFLMISRDEYFSKAIRNYSDNLLSGSGDRPQVMQSASNEHDPVAHILNA